MAAEDVASAVGQIAVGTPVNRIIEVAGPEQFRLDDFILHWLRAHNDARTVVTDTRAGYFGVEVEEDALIPGKDALLGRTISRPGSPSSRWVPPAKAGGRVLLNSASMPCNE